MTPDQKRLVRETWDQVTPIADTAAMLFYDRLFEIDPDLRDLFRETDMAAQRDKLVATLAHVVQNLDYLEILVPTIEDLGRRHVGYGVTGAHYDTVGAALLWTLKRGLGDSWTSETEAAWTAAYGTISGIMRRAAAGVTPADSVVTC